MKFFLKRHANDILTCLSILGLVGTSVATGVATKKFVEENAKYEKTDAPQSKMKTIGKCYIPAIGLGLGTIACIVGANMTNKKTQRNLTIAYALLDQSFKRYREGLIELHGQEADDEVRDYVVGKYCNYHRIHDDTKDERLTWYEPLSNTTFKAYEKEVIDAEYHFNRNWILSGGCADVNNYFSFLGIDWDPEYDGVGWWMEDGLMWVDFEHRLTTLPNGNEVYSIWPVFKPTEEPV